MRKYKTGDKLICVISNHDTFAHDEVVEIERVEGEIVPIYKFKGYTTGYSQGSIDKIFTTFEDS